MILNVGIETEKKGEWRTILEVPFNSDNDMGDGILDVPKRNVALSNGEIISVYSIYVVKGNGLVLGIEQNDAPVLELTCAEKFDLVCSTAQGFGVRFFITDPDQC